MIADDAPVPYRAYRTLLERVAVLERTCEIMAGYIDGFGGAGFDRAKRGAARRLAEVRAASERFERTP